MERVCREGVWSNEKREAGSDKEKRAASVRGGESKSKGSRGREDRIGDVLIVF